MAVRARPDVRYRIPGSTLDRLRKSASRLADLPLSVIVGGIVVLAALLRLWSLASWPVFSDEDSYIQTAILIARSPLHDSIQVAAANTYKAPLLILVHAALVWLGADALVAGRALAAVAGLATTVLTWELGRRLGGQGVGLLAALLYALSPMAILHERMINLDPALTAFTLAATLATVSAIERRSWRLAILAALAGALAVQSKTPGIAIIVAPVVALFVYHRRAGRATLQAGLAMAGPILSYLGLVLSPIGPILSAQNAMLLAPFVALGPNLLDLVDGFWTYFPAGLALVLLPGVVLAVREKPRLAIVMAVMAVVWIAPWVVLGKFAPTRYFMAALPLLAAFIALALVRLPGLVTRGRFTVAVRALVVVMVLASGAAAGRLVLDHATAALSRLDDWQYRSGWPAGYGYDEAASLVRRVAEPGSSVAYVIDAYHMYGAGMYMDLPTGVRSLGRYEGSRPLPRVDGRLYVIADDGRDLQFVEGGQNITNRVALILAERPDLEVVARFDRPHSSLGVSVLRSR